MLYSVATPSLLGEKGILQLRQLQKEMATALGACDYARVRQLDVTCAVLIDKLIAANQDDSRCGKNTLIQALCDLKGVYANLIGQCQQATVTSKTSI